MRRAYLGPLAGLRYRFRPIPPEELMPAGDWPQPLLAAGEPSGGPVMVTVEYWPREGLADDLLAALEDTRFSRRRTGASSWRVSEGAADQNRIIERFDPRHDRTGSPGDGDALGDVPTARLEHRRDVPDTGLSSPPG